MHRSLTLKLDDLNQYLTCPLCKGYLIDSYTVNECLHSFCKSCIIKYVRRNEECPVCKVEIMKDKIKTFLKRDLNLQYIVYKLVPDLFKNEMKRRRTFFTTNPKAIKYRKRINIKDKEALGMMDDEIFNEDKHSDISLSIEYSETGLPEICESQRHKELDPSIKKSYLLCPPSLTIEHLKKFICLKTGSTSTQTIDIMYDDKPLNKEFTLLDVAYVYAWRRSAPMRLFYRVGKSQQETVEKPNVLSDINNIPNEAAKATIEAAAPTKASEPVYAAGEENKENIIAHDSTPPAVAAAASVVEKEHKDDKTIPAESVQVAAPAEATLKAAEKEKAASELTASMNPIPTDHDLESTMNDASQNINDMTDSNAALTHSVNEPEHLTITGMVASIYKAATRRQPDKTEPPPPPSSKTQEPPKTAALNNVEAVSNSDKENDDQSNVTVEVTTLGRGELHDASDLKPELESLAGLRTEVEAPSVVAEAVGEKKEKKPYKRRDSTKKNLAEANVNGSVLTAFNENSNEAAANPAKKKMKMSGAADEETKPKKQPKKGKGQPEPMPPRTEPNLDSRTDSDARSISSHDSSLSHNSQHQQYSQTSHQFGLPFANKLNTSMVPPGGHQLPSMQSNFQMNPMALINHLSSWKTLAEQQQHQQHQQHQPQQPSQHHQAPGGYMANYSAQHFLHEYTKQANSMAAQVLLNQKYPPASIIEYFQTKAAQSLQNQNFFNVYNHHAAAAAATAGLHAHHPSAAMGAAAATQQYLSNLEEFKKPMANFASLIQETYQNNLAANRMSHSTSNSSLHSTCNDNSSLDSLKETQLKISESCNLVNELN